MSLARGEKNGRKNKGLNAQFEAFLKDSLSSEESLDTARVNKYMRQSKGQGSWWDVEEEEETTDDYGLMGTGKHFLKKKHQEPFVSGQTENDLVDTGGPERGMAKDSLAGGSERGMAKDSLAGGPERGMAKDSLDDDSFMAFVGDSAKPAGGVPALSLGSTSFTETGTAGNVAAAKSRDGPGKDTLDEIADKEKFFQDLERETDSTIDYGKLNNDLDETTTAGGPLAGRGFLSHHNDLDNSEDYGDTKPELGNMSEAEKESMLAKVALLDSLDSTLGTKPAGSRDTEELKVIPEARHNGVRSGGSDEDDVEVNGSGEEAEGSFELKAADTTKGLTLKTGTELTDTSQDVELWKQALRQQVDRSMLDDSTRDFTLRDTTPPHFLKTQDANHTADTETEVKVKDTREFGMKPLVPHSSEGTQDRSVDDIIREVEELKQNKTENSVRFDDRVQTQDIVDYGSERHGFDLSPVHTHHTNHEDSAYDLSPLDKYAPGVHPGFDTLDSLNKIPVPARRSKKQEPSSVTNDSRPSRSRERNTKENYSNVRSSGYGKVSPIKSPTRGPSKLISSGPSNRQLRSKRQGNSSLHRSPGDAHRSRPGGSQYNEGDGEEELVASVHSFASYVQHHFSRDAHNKSSQHKPQKKATDDSGMTKGSALEQENQILAEVRDWQEQWKEERKMNVKLKAELSALKREHASKMEKLKVEHESQLEQLQQQNYVLSAKLSDEPSRPSSQPHHHSQDPSPSGDDDAGSREQVELLRREVREQERLLAGYQQENERLYGEVKAIQVSSKGAEQQMFRENQKLSRDLAQLREELSQREVELKNKGIITGLDVQQQIASGAVHSTAALGAARISELQEELKQLRSHEELVGREFDEMSRNKCELEAHVKALSAKVEECEARLTSADSHKVKEVEEKFQQEVDRLQRKLKWYAENQELLDRDQAQLKAKDAEIKRLCKEVENSKSQGLRRQQESRSKERAADARRIQDLERQVKEMEGVLKRRNPNSLPVLMWAAAHDGVSNGVKAPSVEHLEKRTRNLEQELEVKDEDSKRDIRVLEQKYNLIKIQYEDRIASLETLLSRYTGVEEVQGEQHPHTHATALQRELDSVRERSRKKIIDLEAQLEAVKKEVASFKAREAALAKADLRGPREGEIEGKVKVLQTEVSSLQRDKQLLEARIDKLVKERQASSTDRDASSKGVNRSRPGSVKSSSSSRPSSGSRPSSDRTRPTSSIPHSQEDVTPHPALAALPTPSDVNKLYEPTSFAGQHISDIVREKEELQAKVERQQFDLDSQRVHLQKVTAETEAQQRQLHEEAEDKICALKAAHQRELQELLSQHALDNSTSSVAQLTAKLHTQEVVVQHLKDQSRQYQQDHEQLAASRIRETTLEAHIGQLKDSLHEARRSHTPEMRHFQALQDKIDQMESRHSKREHDLQQIIRQHHQVASFELEQEVAKWKQIVEAKNKETEAFRCELETILLILKDLQKQGVILPCKSPGSMASLPR